MNKQKDKEVRAVGWEDEGQAGKREDGDEKKEGGLGGW